jgi:hypothetical protein
MARIAMVMLMQLLMKEEKPFSQSHYVLCINTVQAVKQTSWSLSYKPYSLELTKLIFKLYTT